MNHRPDTDMTAEAPASPEQPEIPDLAQLLKKASPETLQTARANAIQEVLATQKLLAKQFSRIDHPLATEDQHDDYQLALEEFTALINRVVVLPQSVEGIQFLERYYQHRVGQIDELIKHANPGTTLTYGEGGPSEVMTEDFARGMRAALHVVRDKFSKFPLTMTLG